MNNGWLILFCNELFYFKDEGTCEHVFHVLLISLWWLSGCTIINSVNFSHKLFTAWYFAPTQHSNNIQVQQRLNRPLLHAFLMVKAVWLFGLYIFKQLYHTQEVCTHCGMFCSWFCINNFKIYNAILVYIKKIIARMIWFRPVPRRINRLQLLYNTILLKRVYSSCEPCCYCTCYRFL